MGIISAVDSLSQFFTMTPAQGAIMGLSTGIGASELYMLSRLLGEDNLSPAQLINSTSGKITFATGLVSLIGSFLGAMGYINMSKDVQLALMGLAGPTLLGVVAPAVMEGIKSPSVTKTYS